MGPGGGEDLTGKARKALAESDIIVGYTVYIDLIRAEFGHKELLTTPMRKEQERCEMALALADTGKDRGHGLLWRPGRVRHGGALL